jgi:hypothetical protein
MMRRATPGIIAVMGNQSTMENEMKQLPIQVHGHAGGNHGIAIARTNDIHDYVKQAVQCLTNAADENVGSHIRGGNLREADEFLDTIIRYAQCAKNELRIAHCPDSLS